MNYHIGRLVLSSLCVGTLGAAGFWWFSFLSCASACKTNTTKNQPHQKLQHTTNFEQDRCGNSSTHSQAPDDGYINVRNMLSTYEMK